MISCRKLWRNFEWKSLIHFIRALSSLLHCFNNETVLLSFKSRFPASVRFISRTVIYQVWIKFFVTIKQAFICLAANAAKFFTSLTICWALGVIELRVNRYKSVKCLGVVWNEFRLKICTRSYPKNVWLKN